MEKTEIVLVVLHYLLAEETIKCIESFENRIDTSDYKIVVVDNCSGNGSVERLQQYFKSNKKVYFVFNEANLGFSAGNNRGITFARKEFDPNFIVVSNNDVLLDCDGMLSKLEKEYGRSGFAVAGPHIINRDTKDHLNVNPYKYTLPEIELYGIAEKKLDEVKNGKGQYFKRILKYIFYKTQYFGYNIYYRFKRKTIKNNVNAVKSYNERFYKTGDNEYNVILHGCYLIFTRKYFDFFDGFDEMLYMYGEELLLYYHLSQKGLCSVYLPEIQIIHNHAASTKALSNPTFFIDNYSKSHKKLNWYLYFEKH